MRRSRVVFAVGVVVLVLGLVLSWGAPRLTLTNAGIRIHYPWGRGVAAIVGACGAGLLVLASRRTPYRLVWCALSLGVLAFGVDRLRYRIEADGVGIAATGVWPGTRLLWEEVQRVDAGPAVLVLWGSGDSQIRISTSDFRPDQRAVLDRTIARRVRESQPRPPR